MSAAAEADADADAAVGSNKRSRLNVAECIGDASNEKKSDQRKKEAKISESLMEWRMCTAAMAEKLMDPEHGPDMLNSPHLTEFRSLVEFIAKRPDVYDLDIDDNEGGSLEYYTEAGLANVLAPDLIQAMQGWQFEPPEEAPVVQLVAIEAKKEAGYGKDDPIRRTISVSVSDVSRRTIRGRLAVSAKGVECLRPGHIVRLNRFCRYVVRPTDKYDMTEVWMLIVDLTIVGIGPTASSAVVAYPTTSLADIVSDKPAGGDDDHGGDDDDGDWDPSFELPPKPNPRCTASKRLCSLYGQVFTSRCVCEQMPVPEDLEAVYDAYQGTTEPLEAMSNSHKRNMIYWMYATDVFMVRGQGVRRPLPPCLVYCIRCKYPNSKGVEYKGYEAYGGDT
jgi:hypothetical protein